MGVILSSGFSIFFTAEDVENAEIIEQQIDADSFERGVTNR
jgi:hypothetical protein